MSTKCSLEYKRWTEEKSIHIYHELSNGKYYIETETEKISIPEDIARRFARVLNKGSTVEEALDKINIAIDLRIRALKLDIECYPKNTEFYRGGIKALEDLYARIESHDLRYIEAYIDQKKSKYMTESEKKNYTEKYGEYRE